MGGREQDLETLADTVRGIRRGVEAGDYSGPDTALGRWVEAQRLRLRWLWLQVRAFVWTAALALDTARAAYHAEREARMADPSSSPAD